MIKVNLIRDATATNIKKDPSKGGATFTQLGGDTRIAGESNNKAIIIRLALLVAPYFASMAYVDHLKTDRSAILQGLKQRTTQASTKAKGLETEIGMIQNLKKERERVDNQINTIKTLSRERLRNVKALAAVQEIIPEKAWLSNLKISDNKIELKGNAVDDRGVSDFIGALETNRFFENVRLIKANEVSGSEGIVKAFEIEANLGGD